MGMDSLHAFGTLMILSRGGTFGSSMAEKVLGVGLISWWWSTQFTLDNLSQQEGVGGEAAV